MPIHYYDLPQVRSRKIKFLYLGSIYGKRNPKQLYRVLNDMMENNPTIEFVLAGSKLDRNILIEQYKNFGFGL
ncbi:hypothetical protein [Flavobacterium haoranii]|nr:hypothetical protein [Flavobacterium haoranii]